MVITLPRYPSGVSEYYPYLLKKQACGKRSGEDRYLLYLLIINP
jgi:hypothetical protein